MLRRADWVSRSVNPCRVEPESLTSIFLVSSGSPGAPAATSTGSRPSSPASPSPGATCASFSAPRCTSSTRTGRSTAPRRWLRTAWRGIRWALCSLCSRFRCISGLGWAGRRACWGSFRWRCCRFLGCSTSMERGLGGRVGMIR